MPRAATSDGLFNHLAAVRQMLQQHAATARQQGCPLAANMFAMGALDIERAARHSREAIQAYALKPAP